MQNLNMLSNDDDEIIRSPDETITTRLIDDDNYSINQRELSEEEQMNELMEINDYENMENQIMKQIMKESKRENLESLIKDLNRVQSILELKYIDNYNELMLRIDQYIESEDESIYYDEKEYEFINFLVNKTILRKSIEKDKLINLIIIRCDIKKIR